MDIGFGYHIVKPTLKSATGANCIIASLYNYPKHQLITKAILYGAALYHTAVLR